MMVAIFTVLTLAFALQWGRPGWATAAAALALSLALGLFLWEVWDPQRGFAMPWLNVQIALPFVTSVPA